MIRQTNKGFLRDVCVLCNSAAWLCFTWCSSLVRDVCCKLVFTRKVQRKQ